MSGEQGEGVRAGPAVPEEGLGSIEGAFPDFFIAGAPRCGTTSLASYLRDHPEICFSSPKETHYFVVSAVDPELRLDVERHYVDRFFPHYDADVHRIMGEGSVTYLYFPNTIEQILALNPKARFIVMLRNPVEMVPSFHSRMLWVLEEDAESFAEAWDLQAARARGERIPPRCLMPSLLQYAEIGKLGKHVNELLARVPRSQCLFIVYEDFIAGTGGVYRSVLEFLGVDHDGRTKFGPRAGSQGYRYRWLQQLLFKPPGPVMNLVGDADAHRSRLFQAAKAVRQRLVFYNTRGIGVKAPLSRKMEGVLRDTFRSDGALLGELIGRDLSNWYP
jgi:hypothetical protein